ncbi:hypothetical protein FQZ97_1185980 [compost metagenome]
MRNPVKISVRHGDAQSLIALHQRECRAWHLKPLIIGNRTDDRAGKRGFACAKIARQGDEIAFNQR